MSNWPCASSALQDPKHSLDVLLLALRPFAEPELHFQRPPTPMPNLWPTHRMSKAGEPMQSMIVPNHPRLLTCAALHTLPRLFVGESVDWGALTWSPSVAAVTIHAQQHRRHPASAAIHEIVKDPRNAICHCQVR